MESWCLGSWTLGVRAAKWDKNRMRSLVTCGCKLIPPFFFSLCLSKLALSLSLRLRQEPPPSQIRCDKDGPFREIPFSLGWKWQEPDEPSSPSARTENPDFSSALAPARSTDRSGRLTGTLNCSH